MSVVNKAWDGPPRIIFALDIGIRYSQVAYAILRTGEDISLRRVAQWPGREFPMKYGSVTTALYYNLNNEVMAAGDETSLPDVQDRAEDNNWKLVRCFPRQLYPPSLQEHLPECEALPAGLSLSSVYADYIKYLMGHARKHFFDFNLDGETAWTAHSKDMIIAFTVPYSWSFREHGFLQDAFLQAEPGFTGSFRFVEQGEALIYGSMLDNVAGITTLRGLSSGSNVVMCNSQDAWTEIVAYRVDTHMPEFPRFIPASGARGYLALLSYPALLTDSTKVQLGWSAIIDGVKEYLRTTLGGYIEDREEVDECAAKGAIDFEWKRTFTMFALGEQYHIEIAGTRFHRPKMNVRRGRMIVQSAELKSSFDPCVNAIVAEVDRQVSACENGAQLVITLGGLTESPYLKQALEEKLQAGGASSETYSTELGNVRNTRVAEPFWTLFHDHLSPRIVNPGLSFGILVGQRFDEDEPDHQGRKVYPGHGGFEVVANRWSEIGKAVDLTNTNPRFRRKMVRSLKPARGASLGIRTFRCDIWGFMNGIGAGDKNKGWVKDKDGQINAGFRKLCRVEVDLSDWAGVLTQKYAGTKSKDAIELDLIVEADESCYRAYIEWKEGISQSHSTKYASMLILVSRNVPAIREGAPHSRVLYGWGVPPNLVVLLYVFLIAYILVNMDVLVDTYALESIQAMTRKYDSSRPRHFIGHGIRRSGVIKEHVVVTGTTGGLGSHLLAQLLASDKAERIWALNRKSNADNKDRQRVSLGDKMLETRPLASEKLVFVDAALDEAKLGLSNELCDEIRNTTTVVIHNAWKVNFNLALQSFEANIQGTRNLLDLAFGSTAPTGPPRFAFTSSISVTGFSGLGACLHEVPIRPEDAVSTTGYGQTNTEVQTPIVRLGQLTGDVESGSWNMNDWVPSMIASSLSIGCLPAAVGTVSWLPLNVAARSIIDTCTTCDEELLSIIHASHPCPVPWVDIMSIFSALLASRIEFTPPLVELSEWNKRVTDRAAIFQGPDADWYKRFPSTKIQNAMNGIAQADQQLRSRAGDEGVESAGTVRLVTTKAEQMSGRLRSAPRLGREHVEKWFDYWEAKGLFAGHA
ncbi:hypothetical protein FRC11_001886 [Ceratobasidium sp. 423]|nr:hypothetical protein FRC11_001886 [Ceratobasidium sp. 423]